MSTYGKIYIVTSGIFVSWAILIVIHRLMLVYAGFQWLETIKPFLIVPYVFLYPVSFALTWFVERSMVVHFKHRILVWIPMACAGGLYLFLGVAMLKAPDAMGGGGQPPPSAAGWFLVGTGGVVVLLSIVSALLLILTGRFLAQHRYRVFCLIIAGLCCLSVPLGTVLGVFTFVVVLRPSVSELFRQKAAEPATGF